MASSGVLKNDAFNYVGDIFALIDRGFDDLEDFLPLDDLDGVLFFVKKLSDERAAETVTLIFAAIDFDDEFERTIGAGERFDAGNHFRGGGDQHFDEVGGAWSNFADAIENEAAGGGVDEINDIVQTAAEFVKILTIERGNESLVELGEDGVGDVVAVVLDGFDALHLLGHPGVVIEHLQERFGARMNVLGLPVEQVEETAFVRQQSLQKSRHVGGLSLKSL
jgi:hypothetical protein